MEKKEKGMLEVAEMRMLRRIKEVTLNDNWERSENIRKELEVCDINEKVRAIRMRWYGHVMRIEEAMNSVVAGRRRRGRRDGRTT